MPKNRQKVSLLSFDTQPFSAPTRLQKKIEILIVKRILVYQEPADIKNDRCFLRTL